MHASERQKNFCIKLCDICRILGGDDFLADCLTVIPLGNIGTGRLKMTLESALEEKNVNIRTIPNLPLHEDRILFVVALDESGVNHDFYNVLRYLRTHSGCLSGCVGGVLIDGTGNLYTKSMGRELVLAASMAGCIFPGRPLVEATGELRNFAVQAKNAGCNLEEAYRLAIADLVERISSFIPSKFERPKILAIHASNHRSSNTLALWNRVKVQLEDRCDTDCTICEHHSKEIVVPRSAHYYVHCW